MANLPFSFFKQNSKTYEVKDATARNDIAQLSNSLSNKIVDNVDTVSSGSGVLSFDVPTGFISLVGEASSGTLFSWGIRQSDNKLVVRVTDLSGNNKQNETVKLHFICVNY